MTWEIFSGLLSQIAVGGITAVLASIITVRLSLGRFVSEKWWEKKAATYGVILEALHHMKRAYDEDCEAYESGREIPKELQEKLTLKYHEAKEELYRRVEVEQFFLPANLLAEIKNLHHDLDQAGNDSPHDYYLHIDESWKAINVAQEKVRAIAKSDLEVIGLFEKLKLYVLEHKWFRKTQSCKEG